VDRAGVGFGEAVAVAGSAVVAVAVAAVDKYNAGVVEIDMWKSYYWMDESFEDYWFQQACQSELDHFQQTFERY